MDIAPLPLTPPAWPRRVRVRSLALLSVVTREWGKESMPSSDELNDLAGAVATTRDRQAFAVLFKHFAPRIKAYLVRAGSAPDIAEELVQETMVSFWRKAASFDPARAQLSTWLFTIARNLRIDRHRRDGGLIAGEPASDDEQQQVADSAPSPEELYSAGHRERRVRLALARLSDEQALLLRLSFYEDQPHAQIARDLSIPLGTVKSRIRLAVSHLRRLLGDIGTP